MAISLACTVAQLGGGYLATYAVPQHVFLLSAGFPLAWRRSWLRSGRCVSRARRATQSTGETPLSRCGRPRARVICGSCWDCCSFATSALLSVPRWGIIKRSCSL